MANTIVLDNLIDFTPQFAHVKKAFLEANNADEAVKVLVDAKFAISWHIKNLIVEYFEADKDEE